MAVKYTYSWKNGSARQQAVDSNGDILLYASMNTAYEAGKIADHSIENDALQVEKQCIITMDYTVNPVTATIAESA